MMTKKEREKLEQDYINQSLPTDSRVKELIRTLQDVKTFQMNLEAMSEQANNLAHILRYELDSIKNKKK